MDPVAVVLGVDVAQLVRRYEHQSKMALVNKEYLGRLMSKQDDDALMFSHFLSWPAKNGGPQFFFNFRHFRLKHHSICNWKNRGLVIDLPDNY